METISTISNLPPVLNASGPAWLWWLIPAMGLVALVYGWAVRMLILGLCRLCAAKSAPAPKVAAPSKSVPP